MVPLHRDIPADIWNGFMNWRSSRILLLDFNRVACTRWAGDSIRDVNALLGLKLEALVVSKATIEVGT